MVKQQTIFGEVILRGKEALETVKVNERFETKGGYIQVRSRNLFRERPAAML